MAMVTILDFRTHSNRTMSKKGFTLIELLITIFIIILIVQSLIKIFNFDYFKRKEVINKLNLIRVQVLRYYDMYGFFPDNEPRWIDFLRAKEEGGKFFSDVPRNPYFITINPAYGWEFLYINGVFYVKAKGFYVYENGQYTEYKLPVYIPKYVIKYDENVNVELLN